VIARIRLSFEKEGASAEAELLGREAPRTCEAISGRLPLSGLSHHAIYSGSECVLLLPEMLKLEPENATTKVSRGEIAFTWLAAGSHFGVTDDLAEICWFYDRDAEPRMWEGPVPVNIFARIIEPATAFYDVCRRMRREGVKPLKLELAP
jgi:hypothetical protein